jgi:aryl-alcohol dehydrogenase-like predicted oxidoreductase
METRKLGQTGVEVSALCLGAMYFGSRNDKETSYRILDAYIGAGGTFIDSANIYAFWIAGCHGGESETLLGEWMREHNNRSKLFLASKVGFGYEDVPKALTAKLIEDECNKSLKRMNIDTIDLFYGHVDDRNTPLEETMQAFDRLVKAGKVRYVGASNYLAWRLEQARLITEMKGWAQFCCVQQRYTYLRLRPGKSVAPQEMVNDDLLDYCKSTGLTLLPYSVLEGGAYVQKDAPLAPNYAYSDNEKRLEVLRAVAGETNSTVNQVIVAWMLHNSPLNIPLVAASTTERIQENLGALNLKLSADQMERLNTAGLN